MATPWSEWRLSTPEGTKYELIDQNGSFGREDASWRVVVRIRSVDLAAFVTECFPIPIIFGSLIIYPRRFYPTGLPSLECKRVSVEGFTTGRPIDPFSGDLGAAAGTYEEFLRATLEFGPCPSNDSDPDPSNPFTYLQISSNNAGEFLTSEINQDDLRWADSAGTKEDPGKKDVPIEQLTRSLETEWTVKWPQVPFAFYQLILIPRMRGVMGKVNDASMLLFASAPAETILFDGFTDNVEYTWRGGFSGASPVEVTLRFVEKNFVGRQLPVGGTAWQDVNVTHNHVWRPNHGWMRPLIKGTPDDKPLYEQADLTSIFG